MAIDKKSPLAIQPGFPGQIGLLAQQMNQGFGGGILAQQDHLNSIYRPVQQTYTPDPVKPVDPNKPADPAKYKYTPDQIRLILEKNGRKDLIGGSDEDLYKLIGLVGQLDRTGRWEHGDRGHG
jgi:hypothetical protein